MTQSELQEYIIARIYPNNAHEITGASLQDVLLAIVANSQNEEEATAALAQLATDIAAKQDTLTLTTKPNGNIVIDNLAGQSKEFMPATPSGDPMHSWYESLGAVWNATTGYWEFLGVNDMTNEDMLEEAILGNSRIYPTANLMSYTATARVLFGQKNMLLDNNWAALKADNLVANNRRLEVIQFSTYKDYPVFLSSFTWACANCSKLRKILNIINVSMGGIYNAFDGCTSLEEVLLQALNKNVSFPNSPLLSKESLLYMINNCASNVSFTITLHPDVYAKCTDADNGEWYDDVVNAIDTAVNSKNTTITLASA